MWQYAQLIVSYSSRPAADGGEWTLTWYGRDSTTQSKTGSYADVLVELNAAGIEDWELIDVAASGADSSGRTPSGRDWALTTYTFRRPASPAVSARLPEITESRTAPFPQAVGAGHATHAQSGDFPAPGPAEPVTLVRIGIYFKPDDDPAGPNRPDSDTGLGTGRMFMIREVGHLYDQPDIEAIESLSRLYQAPGISGGLRDQIRGAAADYAAAWAEGRWENPAWWQTPQSFTLTDAAALLGGSADWLRGLVEHPAADALSAAGANGPLVPLAAGVAARFVTSPVTGRLGKAARICEIAGIVIGTFFGPHALVLASAKLLIHDEANRLLGRGFEQAIDSVDRSLRLGPDRQTEGPGSSRQAEPIDGRQLSPSRGTERDTGLATPSSTQDRPRRRQTQPRRRQIYRIPGALPPRPRPPRSDVDPGIWPLPETWSGADHVQSTIPSQGEHDQAPGRPRDYPDRPSRRPRPDPHEERGRRTPRPRAGDRPDRDNSRGHGAGRGGRFS